MKSNSVLITFKCHFVRARLLLVSLCLFGWGILPPKRA